MKTASGPRLTARYTIIQCLYNMSYCCCQAFASVFLLSRGLTNAQVGITLALGNLLALVCQPALASFADKTKRFALRQIVSLLVAVNALFILLVWIIPPLVIPTIILYIIMMGFFGIYPPLITSMAMEQVNHGMNLNFSLARGMGSAAFAILSFSMGFLVDGVGAWVILPISLGIAVVNTIIIAVFPKVDSSAQSSPKQEQAAQAVGLMEFARRNKRFMVAVMSIVLMYFSHILINTYTIQIVENIGGTNSDMGIASALGGFLELPAMALFPLLMKKLRSAGLILKISAVFFIIKAAVTLLAPNMAVFYGAQCLQFFAFAMYVPASVYYANRVISGADQVKGQTIMGMAAVISGLLGNAIGGFLLDAGGVSLMLTVGLAVSVVGLIILLLAAPGDRTSAPLEAQAA